MSFTFLKRRITFESRIISQMLSSSFSRIFIHNMIRSRCNLKFQRAVQYLTSQTTSIFPHWDQNTSSQCKHAALFIHYIFAISPMAARPSGTSSPQTSGLFFNFSTALFWRNCFRFSLFIVYLFCVRKAMVPLKQSIKLCICFLSAKTNTAIGVSTARLLQVFTPNTRWRRLFFMRSLI